MALSLYNLLCMKEFLLSIRCLASRKVRRNKTPECVRINLFVNTVNVMPMMYKQQEAIKTFEFINIDSL